jgi:DNA topoisomerase IB
MSRGSTPPARPARDAEQAARASGLHYVSDQLPGTSRRRCGRGFAYYQTAGGRRLRRPAELTRIARLGIPPAYQDVWICPDARGHLQATGRDARGRKQYRYHPRWQQVRGNEKFAHMMAFGAALPLLRRQIRQDMAREGLPRRKVLATVAWLLDETRARIGNAAYARDNHSFGITTLQNRHVSFVRGGGAVLSFRGKGGRAARDPRGP